MSLNLDPRRRAMLREMGVRVWQPEAPAVEMSSAIELVAAHAHPKSATGRFTVNIPPVPPVITVLAANRPAPPLAQASRQPATRQDAADSAQAGWLLGEAQTLFAETATPGGARWLVLAETSTASLAAPVLEGNAGKLLGNMLRAAGLDRAGAALLVPLGRQAVAATPQELPVALAGLIAQARPDVVLVMGRLAALALLPSGEPFGKLRGKVHTLHGAKTVVSYHAVHLLRKCEDKAGAWSDLCLAMSVAVPAG